jgi:cytochrome c-type biogenesis protein
MGQYLEAFALGNAAILGNVCMLPLYPGLFVLLADRVESGGSSRSIRWMGVLVLAGVLTAMVGLGALLHLLSRSFSDVLGVMLPVLYGLVAVFGVLMLLDRNPLVRLRTAQVPILSGPASSAFVYGLAMGPLTLPCTGPLIISAFVVGGVAGSGELVDGLVYFLFFGLGFGWPLVLLPLLAAPAQQRMTRFLTRNHRAITIVSGILLLAVAAAGWWFDIRPN